jgi:molecular chaperone GrpE
MNKDEKKHKKKSDNDTIVRDETEKIEEQETEKNNEPIQEVTVPQSSDQQGIVAETEEKKLTALKDKFLRLLAEYDNYRKRASREIEQLSKTANEQLIRELLPILDNLDRASFFKNDGTTLEEYVKGVALIEEQLRDILARVGLMPIEVVGKPFDPTLHEAILQIEAKEHESGVVTAETQKGYMLSDKVIRHAKVIVSK